MSRFKHQESPYARGKVIDTSEQLLRECIAKAEQELGITPHEPVFTFQHKPLELLQQVSYGYMPETMLGKTIHRFYATPRQHEGDFFYNAVMYVLNQEGLLFAPEMRGSFYDHLMDETIGEHTTAEAYGYNEGARQFPHRILTTQVIDLIRAHRHLEKELAEGNTNLESAIVAAAAFEEAIGAYNQPKPWPYFRRFLRALALGNTLKLEEQKLPAKAVVGAVRRVKGKGESRDIYLALMVNLMYGQKEE
ncbi:hypothetical protein HYW21_04370 [Candidatus Woesearchaeota archaeon]|nr:hypothetical protein [Candidatus Woesearchaeota archaeon]